ncbi:MAG: 16S rRNA (cytosine(1402)-N(4))-methyltransferase RsmH [Saprospiraceae bacterium]|nr:16S rRNA (cytosine(1402)-N(4))-methyltransferase RsmH [Saprospiraceae bacterium]
MYHAPVLLTESIEALRIRPEGTYVDATFGGGGHAREILKQLRGKGRLFALDQDEDAQHNAEQPEFAGHQAFVFVHSNFRFLKRQLRAEVVRPGTVDGILADLGVSSHQLDTAERGFSYRFEAELDMRMNTLDGPTAADVLNTYTAEELQRIFSEYGEVRNARTLALACVQTRSQRPFRTTGELVELCEKNLLGERWRYLSQVFQALRMEVNEEIGALRDFLTEAFEMLAPGGRLAIITFHSIEDRLVKNYLKTGSLEGKVKQDFYGNIDRPFVVITKKPIEASAEETQQNTRSRSARLRIAEKKL